MKRAKHCLEFTQEYSIKLASMLMSRRKLCITTADQKRTPFDKFSEFLHFMAVKNCNKQSDESMGMPQQGQMLTGLNNNFMITHTFSCFTNFMETTILQKPVSCFPFHCFFMRDSFDFDEALAKMDRIGGSFTHLENELKDSLKPFNGMKLS